MSDYYEPHPRLRLAKPIVLAGQLGCGAAVTGRSLAAQTGLPFASLDRSIEHEAGRSLARLAVEDGLPRLAAHVDAQLERLAQETPFGLVVLERAWPSTASRETLRRRTHFVHIGRPTGFLRERLLEELPRTGDWILEGLAAPASSDDASALAAIHARRERLLCDAEIVLDAGELHPHRVAYLLLESLERIFDVERA